MLQSYFVQHFIQELNNPLSSPVLITPPSPTVVSRRTILLPSSFFFPLHNLISILDRQHEGIHPRHRRCCSQLHLCSIRWGACLCCTFHSTSTYLDFEKKQQLTQHFLLQQACISSAIASVGCQAGDVGCQCSSTSQSTSHPPSSHPHTTPKSNSSSPSQSPV